MDDFNHIPLTGNYLNVREMPGFGPAAEVLLFRQKDPKPCSPGCGPFGIPSPRHRITWLRNSLRSNSVHQIVEFGTVAQLRPRREFQ